VSAALVSIIGAPAAGKTTLARFLAEALPARLIMEDYAGNPFLAESYQGNAAANLPGQLFFLMSRVGQLFVSDWPGEGVCVSDYGFCQDRVFARQRLNAADFGLYERVARRVGGLVHEPDIVIHLNASVAMLTERIARRGRAFESAMDAKFLQAMTAAYRQTVAALACPIIEIDCDKTDMLSQSARADLMTRIRRLLAKQ